MKTQLPKSTARVVRAFGRRAGKGLPESMKRILRELGRKGGKRRLKTMTPEQRSEQARKAVEARWAKRKAGK